MEVGKSSIIRCLDLLLGKNMQQLYSSISDSDFKNKEFPFSIEIRLTDFNDNELSFFPDEIDPSDGNSLTIRLEATLDEEEGLLIRRYCPKTDSSLKPKQFQSIRCRWNMIPPDLSIKSLDSRRKTIVDNYLEEIDTSDSGAELSNAVNSLCKAIDESVAFSNALRSLVSELDPMLNGGVKDDSLRFVPGAAIDGNLLSDVRLQIKSQSGTMREVTEQSDGTKSLIAFAIYDLLNPEGLIAIDEPEIHLHPSAQRNLIKILKGTNRQLIIATHSGIVAGEFNPDDIAVTRDDRIVQPEQGFLQDNQKTLARWWISNRIELLTSKSIIAVEGQSDRMILARVAELTNRHLERDDVEILEAGGCNEMKHVMRIFGEQGFRLHVSILVDGDAEKKMADELGVEKNNLSSKSIFVSRTDLEDEYVSAIGANRLWDAFYTSSMFTPNQLSNFKSDASNSKELTRLCRKYKIASAVIACNLLDPASASSVSSIVEVLDDVL